MPDVRPWGRRPLTVPSTSRQAWVRLAFWELWMGALVCILAGAGLGLVATAPNQIVSVYDFTSCYGPPPIPSPCERIVYRGGAMNLMFTALCGAFLLGAACWLLWELWSVTEPKPITDDFLRLLHDSFGRNWLNPFTWPWPRVLWAYGFSSLGAVITATLVIAIWTLAVPPAPAKTPRIRIDTSQTFRVGQ